MPTIRSDAARRAAPFCALLGTAAVIVSCGGGGFPGTVTFEGRELVKATGWTRGGLSAVVFVPGGEPMEEASLQLGIIVSRDHAAAVDLQRWILDQYHLSPVHQIHEFVAADESCKVGRDPRGVGPRVGPFIAMQVCRADIGAGTSACAEADEVLGADASSCGDIDPACYQALCDARWLSRRAELERVLASMRK